MYRAAIPPIQRALWLRRKFWDAPKALSLCYCDTRNKTSFQHQDLTNIEQSSSFNSIDSIPQKALLLKLQSIRASSSGPPLLRLERGNTLMKEAEANGVDILCYHHGIALGICADGGLLKQALSIIKAIKDLGRQPHSSNYLNAIVAAGKVRRADIALQLLQEAEQVNKNGHSPPALYCTTLIALGRSGEWKSALKIFHEVTSYLEPTTFLFNSAITACAMNGRSGEAMQLFDSMYKSGVPTTSVTYGAVIDACGRGGKHDKVLHVLNLMESHGLKPTPICYKIAFRGLLVAKDWGGAMEVFSRILNDAEVMKANRGRQVLDMSYESLVAMSKEGAWKEALQVLMLMHESGISVTKRCLEAASLACTNGEAGQNATNLQHIIDSMECQHLTRHAAVPPYLSGGTGTASPAHKIGLDSNAVLSTCPTRAVEKALGGDWESLELILRETVLKPGEIAALFSFAMQHRDSKRAMLLLERQRKALEVVPRELWNPATNRVIMRCYTVMGRLRRALSMLDPLRRKGQCTSTDFLMAVAACSSLNAPVMGMNVLKSMMSGIKGNELDYSAFVLQQWLCAQESRWKTSLHAASEMRRRRRIPLHATLCRWIIDAAIRRGEEPQQLRYLLRKLPEAEEDSILAVEEVLAQPTTAVSCVETEKLPRKAKILNKQQ